jgi:hypothetical protein
MKISLPLVAAAIVLLLVMARAEGIRLDSESHEAFSNQMGHVSSGCSHAHFGTHCTMALHATDVHYLVIAEIW